MNSINWKRVSANLTCPKCGDKAHLSAESDGVQGEHTHTFPFSREMAQELSDRTRTPREEVLESLNTLDNAGIEKLLATIHEIGKQS